MRMNENIFISSFKRAIEILVKISDGIRDLFMDLGMSDSFTLYELFGFA